MPLDEDTKTLSRAEQLPPEILAEIFLHSLAPHPHLRVDRPPWIFGKVCRRWRAVSLSTPPLWVDLPRLYTNTSQYNDQRVLSLLGTSLALSVPMPLSLDLTIYIDAKPLGWQKMPPLLHYIRPHLHRCRELALSTNATGLPIVAGLQAYFGSLQSLKLRFYGPASDFWKAKPLTSMQEAGELRTVSIIIDSSCPENTTSIAASIRPPFVFCWLELPWSRLTKFSATYLTPAYILDVLRNAPRLDECTFTATGSSKFPLDPTPIAHPNLESLSFIYKSRNDAPRHLPCQLIDQLTLSSLKHLHFRYEDKHAHTLMSLIERSHCRLLSLSTYATDLSGHIVPLLGSVPGLQELEIHNVNDDDLQDLVVFPDSVSSALVPALRNLIVAFPKLHRNTMTNLIKSRTSDLTSLQSNNFVRPLATVRLRTKTDSYWPIYHKMQGWPHPLGPSGDDLYKALLERKRALLLAKAVASRAEVFMYSWT